MFSIFTVLKLFERGMDVCFGITLAMLLYRQRNLFFDLRQVRIAMDMMPTQQDKYLFAMLRLSILWLGAWHFGETVFYYAIYVTDKMMVVHHITTVAVAGFIWFMEAYNGYVAIPLMGHYVVTVLPIGMVYSAYASLYVAVIISGFVLWGMGHFSHVGSTERRATKAFVILIIMHTLNLVEFGFTTKKVCQDQYWRMALYMIAWGIGGMLSISWYTPFRKLLGCHLNADGRRETVYPSCLVFHQVGDLHWVS